jgi:hypothetical protein
MNVMSVDINAEMMKIANNGGNFSKGEKMGSNTGFSRFCSP